jgi:uncharacterized protein
MLQGALGARLGRETMTMRKARPATLAASIGLALAGAPAAGMAASFDCAARFLSPARIAICQDAQLSRADEQVARRVASLSCRLAFGQYLGLRHWHSSWAEQRDGCRNDRTCLVASYRSQARFLDRLQQCLDNGLQRRACLRNTLNIDREVVRRRLGSDPSPPR